MKQYSFDTESNLWRRPDFTGIDYSDGQEIEERIYDIISNASDCSVFSEELWNHITDWPTEYHFSSLRHCLLRPLDIQSGDRVLELGCGCGAMTRYLGETGADVVAVEGGQQRARIAARRCQDLENVRVVLDNLVAFDTDERFDWVLLIGVLEYAPLFTQSGSGSPVQKYLSSASSFLLEEGKLVIAIENQLGLKYFNGCGEDHTGVPYFGLNDLYGDDTAVTYGKKELATNIKAAGFTSLDFFYPYPDYKLPNIVVHSSAFNEESVRVSDLLIRTNSRDYQGNRHRLFSEQFVTDVLERNQLLEDFSNSFLVVAAKQKSFTPVPEKDFVWIYSSGGRQVDLSIQTIFSRNDDGTIQVVKKRIATDSSDTIFFGEKSQFLQSCGSSLYHHGKILIRGILHGWLLAQSKEEAAKLFLPWFTDIKEKAFLQDSGDAGKLEEWLLTGDYIDAVPFNCIETNTGQLVYFDKEWAVTDNIQLGWLLFRAIVQSLSMPVVGMIVQYGSHPREVTTVQFIMEYIGKQCGLAFESSSIEQWQKDELHFLKTVGGRADVSAPLEFGTPANVITHVKRLEERIRCLEEVYHNRSIGERIMAKLARLFQS